MDVWPINPLRDSQCGGEHMLHPRLHPFIDCTKKQTRVLSGSYLLHLDYVIATVATDLARPDAHDTFHCALLGEGASAAKQWALEKDVSRSISRSAIDTVDAWDPFARQAQHTGNV